MEKLRVAIVGATGMVGQRFVQILDGHPWFQPVMLVASARSAGKTYEEALAGRWRMKTPIPDWAKNMVIVSSDEREKIAESVDFLFCAVDMPKSEIRAMEEDFARRETPVISNNSACRLLPDVPMLIPEINPDHAGIIEFQKKRLGTQRGFIAVKPNCSIQGYVPPLTPLWDFGIEKISVCTYQAISGAGKTFDIWPEMVDNVIPYIGGEEEKSEIEPLKLWGSIQNGEIVPAVNPVISAQCLRVATSDGHMAAVSVSFAKKPSAEEIIERWRGFVPLPQQWNLPSAPQPFLTYFDEPNRPQVSLDRDIGGGMGVSIGRLREDKIFDYKFVALAHNTLRGAAGGGVLSAEFLTHEGYLTRK